RLHSPTSSADWRGSKAGRCSERSSSPFDEPLRASPMTPSRALVYRVRRHVKVGVDAALGSLAVGMLRTIRATNRKHMADFAGSLMRMLGPRLKEHKIGRANLMAAFPEKS